MRQRHLQIARRLSLTSLGEEPCRSKDEDARYESCEKVLSRSLHNLFHTFHTEEGVLEGMARNYRRRSCRVIEERDENSGMESRETGWVVHPLAFSFPSTRPISSHVR